MNETVLLVEDDASPTDSYIEEMEDRGLRVTWVRDADAALDAVRTLRPDVIVLDLKLDRGIHYGDDHGEKTTGELLYEDLRQRFPRTPFIFWTKFRDIADRTRFPAGVQVVVKQNTDPGRFADLIQHAAPAMSTADVA